MKLFCNENTVIILDDHGFSQNMMQSLDICYGLVFYSLLIVLCQFLKVTDD